jgi:hypothetical protein
MNKKLFNLGLITLLTTVALTACGEAKMKAEDVIDIKLSGTDGHGSIKTEFDYDNIEKIMKDKLGKDYEEDKYSLMFDVGAEIDIDGDTQNLSNGDKIKISLDLDDDDFEKGDIKFSAKSFTYTVSGLEEAKELDVFEGLTIDYEGISPLLQAKVNTDNCSEFVKNNVKFSLSNIGNVADGEKITVTASVYGSTLEENGYILTNTTKDYTVENQPFYITEVSDYDFSEIENIINTEANAVLADVQEMYPSNSVQASIEVMGSSKGNMVEYWQINSIEISPATAYLFVNKEMTTSYSNNYLRFYGITINATKTSAVNNPSVSDGYAVGDTADFLTCVVVCARNIVDNGDGTLNLDTVKIEHTLYDGFDYVDSLEALEQSWIDGNKDSWSYTKID